jgi:hypothetical protein
MVKKAPIEVGDKVLVELPVTAVWDDGRITVEVTGVALSQRVTIWNDSDAIVEVRKAPKARGGRLLFDRSD